MNVAKNGSKVPLWELDDATCFLYRDDPYIVTSDSDEWQVQVFSPVTGELKWFEKDLYVEPKINAEITI